MDKIELSLLLFSFLACFQNGDTGSLSTDCKKKTLCDARKECEKDGMSIVSEKTKLAGFFLAGNLPSDCTKKDLSPIFWIDNVTNSECEGQSKTLQVSGVDGSGKMDKDKHFFFCESPTTTIKRSTQETEEDTQSQYPFYSNENLPDKGASKPTPEEIHFELDSLNGEFLPNVKKFENEIAQKLTQFDDGTVFHSQAIDVIVKQISPTQERSVAQSSIDISPPGAVGATLVTVPLYKIRSKYSTSDLTVIVANWKLPNRTFDSTSDILPENGSVLTVKYFLESPESLPVSYDIDLGSDLSEISDLSPRQKLIQVEQYCGWLDLDASRWSKRDCRATIQSSGVVTCHCNHTTTFSVLLNLQTVELPEIMDPVTMALEAASISCLFLTTVFLLIARQGAGIDSTMGANAWGMRINRTNSQISICVSLLIFHIALLCSDAVRLSSDKACEGVTFITHYFLLASVFWSLNEGLGIFIKMLPHFTMNVQYRKLTVYQTLIGWAVPLIIAAPCLAYGLQHANYMDTSVAYQIYQNKSKNTSQFEPPRKYDQCWLGIKSGMIFAAFFPVLLVVIVNIIILCYVIKGVSKMNQKITTYGARPNASTRSGDSYGSGNRIRYPAQITPDRPSVDSNVSENASSSDLVTKQKRRLKHVVSVTRSFAILMPILAIPWVLAFFANIKGTAVPLLIVHTVVNGLQGVQIFVLYCIVSKADWKRVKRKWKNSKLSRMYSDYCYRRESIAAHSTRVTSLPQLNVPNGNTLSKNEHDVRNFNHNAKYGTLKLGPSDPAILSIYADPLKSKYSSFNGKFTHC